MSSIKWPAGTILRHVETENAAITITDTTSTSVFAKVLLPGSAAAIEVNVAYWVSVWTPAPVLPENITRLTSRLYRHSVNSGTLSMLIQTELGILTVDADTAQVNIDALDTFASIIATVEAEGSVSMWYDAEVLVTSGRFVHAETELELSLTTYGYFFIHVGSTRYPVTYKILTDMASLFEQETG